jgi:hypothetical protein
MPLNEKQCCVMEEVNIQKYLSFFLEVLAENVFNDMLLQTTEHW